MNELISAFSKMDGLYFWFNINDHLFNWSFNYSWEVIDSVQEGKSGSGSPFTDFWTSLKLFIEETSSFKQQNPGKVWMDLFGA